MTDDEKTALDSLREHAPAPHVFLHERYGWTFLRTHDCLTGLVAKGLVECHSHGYHLATPEGA